MRQLYLFIRRSSGKYAFVLSLAVTAIGVSQNSIDTVVRFGSYVDSAQWLSVFVGIIGGAVMAGASALDQFRLAGPDSGSVVNVSVRGGLVVRLLVALSTLFWALALLVSSVIMVDLRVSNVTSSFEFPGWVYALVVTSLAAWVFGGAALAMMWPSRIAAIVASIAVYSIYVVTSLASPNSVVKWFIPVTDETWDPFFKPNPQHIMVVVGSYVAFWLGLIVLCAGLKSNVAMATLAHRLVSTIMAPALIVGAVGVMLQQAARPYTAPFFATRVEPPSKPVCVTVRPDGSICVWPQHEARISAWTAGLAPALAATKGLDGFPTQFNEPGLSNVKGRVSLQTSDPVQASGQITLEALSVVPSRVQLSCPAVGTVFALAMVRVLMSRVGATGIAADVGQPSWTHELAVASRVRQDTWLSEVGRAVQRGCDLPTFD